MHNSFNPHEVALLAKVVEDACAKLGCDEVQKANVAERVVLFAANGTRDYETLLAVATLQRDATDALIINGQYRLD